MKFDMHCHTHEGSPDSHVSVEEYIRLLSEQGYRGMLITDHDSYNGYRYWKENICGKAYTDFVVLRGVEYDTSNAGHFIVVLPSDDEPTLLERKGMTIEHLIEVVHSHGGILGPAHPFGESFLSIYRTGKFKRDRSITEQFDFLEGFNSCEDHNDNDMAVDVANEYNKPVFAGSDSHKASCVGTAATLINADVKNEDDLIAYIQHGGRPVIGGDRWYGTIKDHLGPFNKLLVYGFFFYNKAGAAVRTPSRWKAYRDYK